MKFLTIVCLWFILFSSQLTIASIESDDKGDNEFTQQQAETKEVQVIIAYPEIYGKEDSTITLTTKQRIAWHFLSESFTRHEKPETNHKEWDTKHLHEHILKNSQNLTPKN